MLMSLLMPFILLVVLAYALKLVSSLVKAWTWLYTSVAPEGERSNRREEVLSDLHEHIQDSRAGGHRPAEIAVHLLLRMLCGVKDDLAWSAPYLPSAMAERLERGGEALSQFRTPTAVITSLAVFSLLNASLFLSDGDKPWTEFLVMNVSACAVIFVMHHQQRPWARRIIQWYLGIATALLVSVLVWVVLYHRVYEMPGFYRLMLQFAVAMLPLILAMLVSSERCRARFFKGRWWPVFASWGLIAAISLGTAMYLGLSTLTTVWTGMTLVTLALVIVCAVFAGCAAVVCHGGLKGGAGLLRLMAAGIRHLT